MEGDRWMVTLFGMLGEHPPTDEAGFLEFARSLPAPDVHEVIAHAEPITESDSLQVSAEHAAPL